MNREIRVLMSFIINMITRRRSKLRRHRKILILLLTLTIYLCIYFKIYSFDSEIKYARQNDLKLVHVLTGRFDHYNWQFYRLGFKMGRDPFRDCPESRCYAVQSYPFVQSPLEEADGVLVHGPNLWYLPDRRVYKRNPRQLWLMYTMESQGLTWCSSHYEMTDLDDWFNLTATFKQDSSIPLDYKQFRTWDDIVYDLDYVREFRRLLYTKFADPTKTITDLSRKKKKPFVIWYVSHCETYSRRENLVMEMIKYIDVDIYGECAGVFPNSFPDPCKSKGNVGCINELMNQYKFYLAFENCQCKDYITEKYWKFTDSDKIFKMNVVTVVRGARDETFKKVTNMDNYYINAYNFKSGKELAEYLHYLNNNDTAYLEFFQWKINLYKNLTNVIEREPEKIRENWNVSLWWHVRQPFCSLCSYLHNETFLSSVTNKIWKMSEWFSKPIDCWDQDEERMWLLKISKYFGYCF